jgi:hypothetical protein
MFATLSVFATGLAIPAALAQDSFVYRGMCDASAAVALGKDHFVVADDEHNALQIYRRNNSTPMNPVSLGKFLGTKEGKESDLEGAAVVGSRIYWISSHGRNKNGKERPDRYRFFATDINFGKSPTVTPVGKVYTTLLQDLATAANLKSLNLAEAATHAPEDEGGLNIEGLAATPDGKLLIGFRSPTPGGRALIVPIENPEKIIQGEQAILGEPILLDLDKRGIRSIDLIGSSYLLMAGPPGDTGKFDIYRWLKSSDKEQKPLKISAAFPINFHPEALFEIPDSKKIQILSDDGEVKTSKKACKDEDPSNQSFRSIMIEVTP